MVSGVIRHRFVGESGADDRDRWDRPGGEIRGLGVRQDGCVGTTDSRDARPFGSIRRPYGKASGPETVKVQTAPVVPVQEVSAPMPDVTHDSGGDPERGRAPRRPQTKTVVLAREHRDATPERALVLDIGMHNGDDTAYYLHRGYQVLAVEASPSMCEMAERRFAGDIQAGHLTIRNVGIAEHAGELEFWVSSVMEWSSFHRANATKGGATATSIRVPTITFASLLDECPTPLYAKVDIEMNDSLCIRDLGCARDLPRYFSFEGHPDAERDIAALAALGYTRFQCVRQNDWRAVTPRSMPRHTAIRTAIVRLDRVPKVGHRVAGRIRAAHYRPRRVVGWRFNPGSSGPFGEDLPARWLTVDETVRVWDQRLAADRRLNAGGLGEWFDIHAALG
jgi:FkbM family methyltransferase